MANLRAITDSKEEATNIHAFDHKGRDLRFIYEENTPDESKLLSRKLEFVCDEKINQLVFTLYLNCGTTHGPLCKTKHFYILFLFELLRRYGKTESKDVSNELALPPFSIKISHPSICGISLDTIHEHEASDRKRISHYHLVFSKCDPLKTMLNIMTLLNCFQEQAAQDPDFLVRLFLVYSNLLPQELGATHEGKFKHSIESAIMTAPIDKQARISTFVSHARILSGMKFTTCTPIILEKSYDELIEKQNAKKVETFPRASKCSFFARTAAKAVAYVGSAFVLQAAYKAYKQ